MIPLFLLAFLAPPLPAAERLVIGMSHGRRLIEGLQIDGRNADIPTVLLVGGLDGIASGSIDRAVRDFENLPPAKRQFNLIAIPLANPDNAAMRFPPAGVAYRDNAESHFIWRWLSVHAPDLLIVLGEDHGLAGAMTEIPTVRLASDARVLASIPRRITPSAAHKERLRRLHRPPREVAGDLAQFYGHDFDSAVYIPAMALIGRLRLGQQADVERLGAPYIDGSKDSLARPTASHLAGHLIFAELAERTGDRRYIDRVRAAADLGDAMPMKDQMSDAVFMACPILASAGKLTGEAAYYDMALKDLRHMQRLDLRPDGLYRHSPLNDAAWGRGNAFPALGLAWALGYLPASHPAHDEMLRSFRAHMTAVTPYQDRDGMWHQVIDRPGSYPEFSATAMIAAAMLRGVRNGWLDGSYKRRVEAAWRGIAARIGPDGALLDVCESTGKQKSEEDYLNRAASSGRDPRGGGMALLLATELAMLR